MDTTVADLVEAAAARSPNVTAVVAGGESLTYAELDGRANRLAHHLQSVGVGPDVLVGVCLGRSLDLAVALLAVLKAGGACVPLDPAYPPERLAFMVDDSAAAGVNEDGRGLHQRELRVAHQVMGAIVVRGVGRDEIRLP